MAKFAILGSGGWGTAVAVMLARRPRAVVRLWGAHPETAACLVAYRENRRQLAGVPIPPNVVITADAAEAVAGTDLWISAIPTAYLRKTMAKFRGLLPLNTPVVSLTKGLEIGTFRRPTEILAEVLGPAKYAALSGPSHAEEVARRQPTSMVAAAADKSLAETVQAHFNDDRFRVYTSLDLAGVELAGALKNVIAVAAGIGDGLGFGDNAKAALLSRGIVEMRHFGLAHGAQAATFGGLAGLGDLIATGFSGHGRNRRLGERIAHGESVPKALAGAQVAEGYFTAKSVFERCEALKLEMPIATAVYRILYEGLPVREAVEDLMRRPPKPEEGYLDFGEPA